MMNKVVHSKRKEPSVALLAAAVLGAWTAGANAQTQITNPLLIPNEPYHVAVGDLNGDDLLDIVVSYNAGNVVNVWEALDEDNFALAESWAVPQAAGVTVADMDGDGVMDIVFGSYLDNSVTIAYGVGDFGFIVDNDNSFVVDVSPAVIIMINLCEWLYPNLLVANSPEGTIMYVAYPGFDPGVNEPEVTLVTKSFELPDCDSGILGPCNNYTIPPCNPNTAGQGIGECMRAADCRMKQCNWAACIEYEDGGFGRGVYYVLQRLACGSANDIEQIGCIAALLP